MFHAKCLLVMFLMSVSTGSMAQLQVPAGVTVDVVIDDISNPQDLALDSLGHMYIANDHNASAQIYRVNLDDYSFISWGPVARDPDAIAVDASDNVYIGDGSGKVHKVSPDGTSFVFATAMLENVVSMTVDKVGQYSEAGTVFVGNARASADIVEINPDGEVSLLQSSGYLHIPFDLMVHPDGFLYVAEASSEVPGIAGLYRVTQSAQLEFVYDFITPFALAYRDSSDEIFVSDQSEERIYRIDDNGTVRLFATGVRARGMVIDHEDNLYVSDTTESPHRILKISGLDNSFSVVGVPDNDDIPRVARVSAYPNPFNPMTTVSFTTETRAFVRIAVYDLDGRLVHNLADDFYGQGTHSVDWKGTDASDMAMPSGSYLIRMESAGRVESTKVMLVR